MRADLQTRRVEWGYTRRGERGDPHSQTTTHNPNTQGTHNPKTWGTHNLQTHGTQDANISFVWLPECPISFSPILNGKRDITPLVSLRNAEQQSTKNAPKTGFFLEPSSVEIVGLPLVGELWVPHVSGNCGSSV